MLLLGSAGLIIMTAGATLHRSALELSQTSSSVLHSSRMGQLFGSVIIIVSQTVFIIHWTQIFTGIELTKEEKAGRLSEPRLRDDAVSWIYAPSSYASLAVLIKLSICGAAICWVIFISLIGMSNPESVYPPIQVHYAFLLSSIYAILGLFYHVFMHWTSFGLLGIISSFVSFSTVGAVMFSLLHSAQPSNGLQTIGIAIALIQTIFLTTTVVLLLHKPYPPVSSDEILTILHTVLVGIICFGWLATIVAIGIRRGGGPPAYTQAVFSGLFTMVGLLVEKTRPGIVIHGFLRALNVFSCILTAAISSASLFSDTESLNSNKIGSIIDFAGSSLLLLGGLFYIMAVFIHSIKPREDLLTQLALQDSKSLFGSNEAVKGSMETLTANKDKKQKEKPDSNESSNDDLAESNSKNSAETVSSQNSPRSLSPDQSDNSTASKPSNGKLKFNKRMKLKEESKSSDSSSSEKNKKASSPKIYSLGSSQETIDSDKTETSARRSSTKSTIMTVLERLKLSSSKKSSSTKASLDSVAAPSTPALKAGSFSLIEQFKKLSPKSSLQSLRSGAFELAPPKSAVTVSAKATHATQEQKSSKGILGSVESVEIIEMTPNA
ncbi:hypothetical protein BC830DRAFT_216630 [Chytriomyces sp. MP71]|nr:hypothetical protein BC830DRAFT_216630 [Chytriomyces sp. MP71]